MFKNVKELGQDVSILKDLDKDIKLGLESLANVARDRVRIVDAINMISTKGASQPALEALNSLINGPSIWDDSAPKESYTLEPSEVNKEIALQAVVTKLYNLPIRSWESVSSIVGKLELFFNQTHETITTQLSNNPDKAISDSLLSNEKLVGNWEDLVSVIRDRDIKELSKLTALPLLSKFAVDRNKVIDRVLANPEDRLNLVSIIENIHVLLFTLKDTLSALKKYSDTYLLIAGGLVSGDDLRSLLDTLREYVDESPHWKFSNDSKMYYESLISNGFNYNGQLSEEDFLSKQSVSSIKQDSKVFWSPVVNVVKQCEASLIDSYFSRSPLRLCVRNVVTPTDENVKTRYALLTGSTLETLKLFSDVKVNADKASDPKLIDTRFTSLQNDRGYDADAVLYTDDSGRTYLNKDFPDTLVSGITLLDHYLGTVSKTVTDLYSQMRLLKHTAEFHHDWDKVRVAMLNDLKEIS